MSEKMEELDLLKLFTDRQDAEASFTGVVTVIS